jgi:hypothetical protein
LWLTGAALLGALGEPVVISRYPKHDSFCRCVFHFLGERTYFLRALFPVVGSFTKCDGMTGNR